MVVERRYSVGERNRADKVAKLDQLSQFSRAPGLAQHKQLDIFLSDRAGGLR